MNKRSLKTLKRIAESEAADAAVEGILYRLSQGKFDRIKRITRLGQYSMFRPLKKRDYELQKGKFRNMPTWETMQKDDGAADFRVLLEPLEIWIETETCNIVYKFERGFIWDLASVPKRLRSIVDNDDRDLMDAAICHDYNFEFWQYKKQRDLFHFGYKQSNALFFHMVKKRSNWFKAAAVWLGVTNRIARRKWRDTEPMLNIGKASLEVRTK